MKDTEVEGILLLLLRGRINEIKSLWKAFLEKVFLIRITNSEARIMAPDADLTGLKMHNIPLKM